MEEVGDLLRTFAYLCAHLCAPLRLTTDIINTPYTPSTHETPPRHYYLYITPTPSRPRGNHPQQNLKT
ncbi:hypothetical protein, partial [Anabaenopsis arnoldii]